MIKKMAANNQSQLLLLQYCKDIDTWPERWVGESTDIQIGRKINDYFKQYLIDCIERKCAKSTIKIYARYLLALGKELIRFLHEDDSDRQLSAMELILKYTDSSGDAYWRHAHDGFEQRRYDSVYKQLFKFVVNIS